MLKSLGRRVMRVDVVPSIGGEVRLRALAGSGEVRRYGCCCLIGWICTVAATVEIVVLSIDNVYGTSEGGCRGVRRAQRKSFAEGISLFIGHLNGENCFDIRYEQVGKQMRQNLLFGSKPG